MKAACVFVFLLLCGCSDPSPQPPQTYSRTGYIHNVWTDQCFQNGCVYAATIDKDDGTETVRGYAHEPPVWVAMIGKKCKIDLVWDGWWEMWVIRSIQPVNETEKK